LEETLLKKGFFQAIFPKLLKVFGKGFKGKTLFQKGFPLKLMTLPHQGVQGQTVSFFLCHCGGNGIPAGRRCGVRQHDAALECGGKTPP
jgi:hypothetical protein